MDYKISMGIVVTLAVAALLYLGSGISGMITSGSASSDQSSTSIYIGLIILMALLVFILSAYHRWILKKNSDQSQKPQT